MGCGVVCGVAALVVAVITGLLIFPFTEDMATAVSFPENIEEQRKNFKEMNKTAFVLGYTGEIGKELTKELLRSKIFSKVVLIGRRHVEFEDELYKDVEQRVIDFEKTDTKEFLETFQGLDNGFTCLGTTRGKSGSDGFYKVDHDYIVNTAKLAKEGGCKHFHLVSSKGANAKSSLLYTKTKGEVEEELKNMEFERLSIYRPGVLMCDREEKRSGEAVVRFLLKPIQYVFPTWITTTTASVAKAMVNCAVLPATDKVELYEIKQILTLAGEHSKK